MHKLASAAVLGLLFSTTTVAYAADAPGAAEPKLGSLVASADGRRFGRINEIENGNAEIFTNGSILYVPLSTLSSTDGRHYVTTLSAKQVEATRR
jgi:hypothetical protein